MKLRRFKTDNENIHWRDTGMIKVYNYPAQHRTFSYITRVYEEFEKDNILITDNKIEINEKNIRNYIIKYFHKDLIQFYYQKAEFTDKNLIQTYFYDLISDINITYINKFIKEILKKLENKNNNFHEYIFSYLILLCIRTKHNKSVQEAENEIFEKGKGDFLKLFKVILGRDFDFQPSGKTSLQTYFPKLKNQQHLFLKYH